MTNNMILFECLFLFVLIICNKLPRRKRREFNPVNQLNNNYWDHYFVINCPMASNTSSADMEFTS